MGMHKIKVFLIILIILFIGFITFFMRESFVVKVEKIETGVDYSKRFYELREKKHLTSEESKELDYEYEKFEKENNERIWQIINERENGQKGQ